MDSLIWESHYSPGIVGDGVTTTLSRYQVYEIFWSNPITSNVKRKIFLIIDIIGEGIPKNYAIRAKYRGNNNLEK